MPKISEAIQSSSGLLRNLGLILFVFLAFSLILTANYLLFSLYPSVQDQSKDMGFDYVVLNKEIGSLNTLLGTPSYLPDELLTQLSTLDGVEDAAFFRSANFKIDAQAAGSMIPSMRTMLFMESVPTRFLDFDTTHWKWAPGDAIPIAVPRSYLELYNYGFSQGNNLPQISEGLIKNFSFKIRIQGNSKDGFYDAKLMDFTNRLNTVLVPEQFLLYANAKYSGQKEISPSRALVKVNSNGSKSLLQFCQENRLASSSLGLMNSKSRQLLTFLLGGVQAIGLLFLVASVWIILLLLQKVLLSNKKNIQTLRILGYPLRAVHWSILWKPVFAGILINAVCLVFLWIILNQNEPVLSSLHFDARLDGRFHWVNLGVLGVLIFFTYFVSLRSVKRIWMQ
jgi:hypothetical protein